MADSSTFDRIRISIASPEDIRSWSRGEVKKPETINYRTFKPERDGLFCERIFGPVKDWECHCGRYKKVKFKGVICDRCGVEVTRSKVRRERMGHIELAAPVSHIWYLKGVPSPMSLLLDMSPKQLERVLYFASYIITHVDRQRINDLMAEIKSAVNAVCLEVNEQRDDAIADFRKDHDREVAENPEWDDRKIKDQEKRLADRIKQEERDCAEHIEELQNTVTLLETCKKYELVTEDQHRSMQRLLHRVNGMVDSDLSDLVKAGMGGASVRELLAEVDLEKQKRELQKDISQTQGAKRLRSIKRLEIVESFLASKSRPEWMILDVVPVISPELRPMVQLDGGRFATSDLNDLYRRIINRNNRLKKITEIRAPESIINHEKRLLQEAVDALIDNNRRARPVVGSNNRPLKSLSDMLKGKEGRFRKNLLGKRVDYSGRSVIVVGPSLKLHQCGLPKEMALELFKPFVMKTLVERRYTSNIKTAKRMIDRMKPEVWDALEEVINEHPVMLNRAPTLHRLGIQAFEPKLVDGKAIQLHPLVCHAFNADFDGDQMAVHVPLSASAQSEARCLMLATHNLFSPADGRPVVAPIQDIVLGSFYLTMMRGKVTPDEEIHRFASEGDALLAYRAGHLDIHDPIKVRLPVEAGSAVRAMMQITVGQLIFNNILPESMRYKVNPIDKKLMASLVNECREKEGKERTIQLLDDLKELGFRYSTFSGATISMTDMDIPSQRDEIIQHTQDEVAKKNRAYAKGLITPDERKQQVLELWTKASDDVATSLLDGIDEFNPISIVTTSGARGSKRQITQLSGMRGLMADPFGNLIEDLPIKSNFHEGLSVLEYFISTHGARKGLADTALRTADAGYLTRRLVDVAQDVIVRGDDCGTAKGIEVSRIMEGGETIETLGERVRGRSALEDIFIEGQKEPVAVAGEIITEAVSKVIEQADRDHKAKFGDKARLKIRLRSPLTCELRQGICARCYGLDLAVRAEVEVGTAVGIIAAQSIGEPGTQLTMRTFHTGGVAGKYLTGVAEVKKKRQESLRDLHDDIRRGLVSFDGEAVESTTSMDREKQRAVQSVLKVLEDQVRGLLRVVELFEARKPKGQAIITEVDGTINDIDTRGLRRVVIHSQKTIDENTLAPIIGEHCATEIVNPEDGTVMLEPGAQITDKLAKKICAAGVTKVLLRRTYLVPYRGNLEVEVDQEVAAGDRLTEGPLDPHKVLELNGVQGVMQYLVKEIQSVYKSQGVDINDKHVEVIVRQMLKKRRISESGDTRFLPGQVVDKFDFEDENARVLKTNGTEATADWVLLGITEASLATDSFLSAASFQKTTRVLTDAAVRGKRDNLVGLKENVIIGRLIPAGTGLPRYRGVDVLDENGEPLTVARQLFDTGDRDDEDDELITDGLHELLAEVGSGTDPIDILDPILDDDEDEDDLVDDDSADDLADIDIDDETEVVIDTDEDEV